MGRDVTSEVRANAKYKSNILGDNYDELNEPSSHDPLAGFPPVIWFPACIVKQLPGNFSFFFFIYILKEQS